MVHCELCDAEGMFCEIAGPHTATCPDVSEECPNKCGETLTRKEVPCHKQVCSLEIVECPFHKVGCDKRLPRKELEEHDATEIQSMVEAPAQLQC